MKTITLETIDPILKPAYLKGYEEGRVEGREEGRLAGLALALLSVLASRGFALTDDQRALVLACRESALLEAWLGRTAVARSVEEVLEAR